MMSDAPPTFKYAPSYISKRKTGLTEHSPRRMARSGASHAPPWCSRLASFFRGCDHKRFPSSRNSAIRERGQRLRRQLPSKMWSRSALTPTQRVQTMPTTSDTTEPTRVYERVLLRERIFSFRTGQKVQTGGATAPPTGGVAARRLAISQAKQELRSGGRPARLPPASQHHAVSGGGLATALTASCCEACAGGGRRA